MRSQPSSVEWIKCSEHILHQTIQESSFSHGTIGPTPFAILVINPAIHNLELLWIQVGNSTRAFGFWECFSCSFNVPEVSWEGSGWQRVSSFAQSFQEFPLVHSLLPSWIPYLSNKINSRTSGCMSVVLYFSLSVMWPRFDMMVCCRCVFSKMKRKKKRKKVFEFPVNTGTEIKIRKNNLFLI